MKQLLGSPTLVVVPATLSCPRRLCGQEWTATLHFDMPGWWLLACECKDTCCPVCGSPGRLKKGARP